MYATNAMIRNLQDRRKFDGKQFSEYLYRSDEAQEANLKAAEGRQPRKPDSHSHQNDNGDEDSEEEKEAEKQQQNSRCETCNKTYLSPKKEQQEFNDWCRSNYRSMAKPENFEHKYVVSCDPAAHCLKNVMVWGPEKLIQGGLEKLRCWDSSCEGHVQTQKKKKVIGKKKCSSSNESQIRRFEDATYDCEGNIKCVLYCILCHCVSTCVYSTCLSF